MSEETMRDYRLATDGELFETLESFDVFLDQGTFLEHAENSELPEELVSILVPEGVSDEVKAEVYLIVFECWRRFCPEKQTLSIFCDELDLTMELYEKEQLGNEEYLQGLLEELARILDEAVDHGEQPRDVFIALQGYFKRDLEAFLYNYISTQIDQEFDTYASELIDAYDVYIEDRLWFDLLRVRLAGDTDVMLDHLIEAALERSDVELLTEVLYFLIAMGECDKFIDVTLKMLPSIRTDIQLRELISMLKEYVVTLDKVDQKRILDLLPEGLSSVIEAG